MGLPLELPEEPVAATVGPGRLGPLVLLAVATAAFEQLEEPAQPEELEQPVVAKVGLPLEGPAVVGMPGLLQVGAGMQEPLEAGMREPQAVAGTAWLAVASPKLVRLADQQRHAGLRQVTCNP